jgi:hypothetical protein
MHGLLKVKFLSFVGSFVLMLVGFPQAILGIYFDSISCKKGVLLNKKSFFCDV